MRIKKCSKCEEIKVVDYFYKKNTVDGYRSSCIECHKKQGREYRENNPNKNREYYKQNKEKIKKNVKIWKNNNIKQNRKNGKDWRERNKEKLRIERSEYKKEYNKRPEEYKKLKCRTKTSYLVKTGKLIKQPCDVCGEVKVEAHHVDYSKPLKVEWLCRKHHIELYH